MKWLAPFVVLCIALAALKVVLVALVVALLLVLAYASVTRPGDTLVFLMVLTVFSIASARPLAFIITLGVVGVAVVVANAWRKARSQQLPTDPRAKPRDQLRFTDRGGHNSN